MSGGPEVRRWFIVPGWACAHARYDNGMSRCGRLLTAAKETEDRASLRKCAHCLRVPKPRPRAAELGIYCIHCGAREPITGRLWERQALMATFRRQHAACAAAKEAS